MNGATAREGFIAVVVGTAVALAAVAPAAANTQESAPADPVPPVVINEVMADPDRSYESRGEWFELHNTGSAPVDLAGWTVGDETPGDEDPERYTLPSVVVPPGGFVVLGRLADRSLNGGVAVDHVYGNAIVLGNTADKLILRNGAGSVVDWVGWTEANRPRTGRSLSRPRPDAWAGFAQSWCAAVTVLPGGDLGTPGNANRCEPSPDRLVITEIMQNPSATTDARGEWFEVFNAGGSPVDLEGYTVLDDDGQRFTVTAPVVVAPGGYAVVARQANNGQVTAAFAYGDAMALNNDFDELVLADRELAQVDRVRWDDGETFPDPDGASMALLDPSADNAVGANWCTSTRSFGSGDRGTPGRANWCGPVVTSPIVITEVLADPEAPASERPAEWFEILNVGDVPVDLTGWTITGGDGATHVITDLVVSPDEPVVLGASDDRARNGDVGVGYAYGLELPLYNNSGRVMLQDADGMVVDRVDWSAASGHPRMPGRSMVLRDPAANGALGANWCPSPLPFGDGDFGSPGVANSCDAPPLPPAVVVSEVLRNPAVVDDSVGEWFELHNTGAAPVDLRGWVVADGASDRHVIRGSLLLPAGGRVVLGRTADRSVNGDVAVDHAYGDGFVLSNGSDAIEVTDRFGQQVDRVTWQRDDALRPNGASIGRPDGTWCESGPQFGRGDRGTPHGAENCTPLPHAAVVINEVHADPAGVNDTVGEWIELANEGTTPVDVNGWVLRDDDFDSHTIAAGGPLVIAPGGQVVLGRDVLGLNGGAPVDYRYGSAFPLLNRNDEINLYDASLVPVDRVAWSRERPLPFASGASAARRGAGLPSDDPASWCTSATRFGTRGDQGTPGRANRCGPDYWVSALAMRFVSGR